MKVWHQAVDAKVVSSFLSRVRRGEGCWPFIGPRSTGGYGSVTFMRAGRHYGVPAHRLAYFIASGHAPDAANHVCHRCDNPICCNPEHLFEGTPKQNGEDRVAKGRQTRGASHTTAKLTEEQALELRKRRLAGEPLKSLASTFGVSEATVSVVARGLRWNHLKDSA